MCDKKISIVGAGMGTAEQLTGLGSRRLREAQVVVGAPRLTEGLSGELSGHAVLASHRTGEIVEFLNKEKWTRAVFLVSGDTGFYSAAASRQHNPLFFRQLIDNFLFTVAEAFFAFNIEDPAHISASAFLNLLIRIVKFHVELLG